MFKKVICFSAMFFLITACADSWDSVKRGLAGQKKVSTDEFLVEKKDPLILPPDFENLPTPDERMIAQEEISLFEKKLEITMEDNSSTSTSTEESILKKIQSK